MSLVALTFKPNPNLAKSNLVPMGNVDNVGGLVGILGCQVVSLPFLGLLLGASYKTKHIWDNILEKIKRRFVSWKMLYLSKGGKITLIKSTLFNLPTYFMSLFPHTTVLNTTTTLNTIHHFSQKINIKTFSLFVSHHLLFTTIQIKNSLQNKKISLFYTNHYFIYFYLKSMNNAVLPCCLTNKATCYKPYWEAPMWFLMGWV